MVTLRNQKILFVKKTLTLDSKLNIRESLKSYLDF